MSPPRPPIQWPVAGSLALMAATGGKPIGPRGPAASSDGAPDGDGLRDTALRNEVEFDSLDSQRRTLNMRGRMKGRKGAHRSASPITREHNIADQSQESTGSTSHVGSAYGMPKAPRQRMAGAAKKGGMPSKIRRGSGANYAGSSGG